MARQLIRPVADPVNPVADPVDDLDLLEPDFDDLITDQELVLTEHVQWVDAAPFRAHARKLIEEFGLTWRTVAVLAEVPAPAMERLIRGRSGRPVPRLHPLIAERLFHLTADEITDAAIRPTAAGPTRALLGLLSQHGWSTAEIICRTGLPDWEIAGVARGERVHCSQLTAATVKAAAQALCTPGTDAGRPRLAPVA